jgi:hypothetical protein
VHPPLPSQVPTWVSLPVVGLQVAVPQVFAAVGYPHAVLAPVHCKSQSLAAPLQRVRVVPTVAPVTGEQVPTLPGKLHAPQESVHALLQHTPSLQKPVLQSLLVAHVSPMSLKTSASTVAVPTSDSPPAMRTCPFDSSDALCCPCAANMLGPAFHLSATGS